MPVALPEPDRTPLANPPIALAVCQVRTEPNPRAADHHLMLRIYEAVGGATGRVPRLTPPSKGVQAMPMGPVAGPTFTIDQPGWRFASVDGDTTVTILEDSFSVETVNYTTWDGHDGFRILLDHVTQAVSEQLAPAVVARLGLRYVNQIVVPPVTSPSGWIGLIDGAFLGPANDEHLRDGVLGLEARTSIDLDAGKMCLLRYGSFLDSSRPGYQTFLVDIDCYREGGVPFSVPGIMSLAEELNTSALAIFQTVVLPDMRAQFEVSNA